MNKLLVLFLFLFTCCGFTGSSEVSIQKPQLINRIGQCSYYTQVVGSSRIYYCHCNSKYENCSIAH